MLEQDPADNADVGLPPTADITNLNTHFPLSTTNTSDSIHKTTHQSTINSTVVPPINLVLQENPGARSEPNGSDQSGLNPFPSNEQDDGSRSIPQASEINDELDFGEDVDESPSDSYDTDPDNGSIEENLDVVQELQIMNTEDASEYEHTDQNIEMRSSYVIEKDQLKGTVVPVGRGRQVIPWKVVDDIIAPAVSNSLPSSVNKKIGVIGFDFNPKGLNGVAGEDCLNFLSLFLYLWPGDIKKQLELVNHEIQKTNEDIESK